MINTQNLSQFHFPYVWPSVVEEKISFAYESSGGFNHMHIHGQAGSGKSRCIAELLKLQEEANKITSLYYCTPNESAVEHDVITSLSQQIRARETSVGIRNKYHSIETEYDLINKLELTSQHNNITIVIEDLHYRDDKRDSLISKIVHQFNDDSANINLITSSRYPYEAVKASNFHDIELQNLSQSEIQLLLESASFKSQTKKIIGEMLLSEGDGLALFISEVMNLGAQIEKDPASDFAEILYSNIVDIADLYNATLSLLNQTEKTILKAASVIGKSFSLEDLLYLLPEHRNYVADILLNLKNKHIIDYDADLNIYSFKHDIQYEHIYKHNQNNEKWAWHLALAEKYKKQRLYRLCGYHYYCGAAYEQSIKYLTYSARKLLRLAQPNEAELFFTRAFDAYRKAGLSDRKSYFKLRIDHCHSTLMQGKAESAKQIMDDLKRCVGNDISKEYYQILSLEINFRWMTANYDKNYIIKLWDSLPDTPSFFTDRSRLIGMLSDIGEYRDSITKTKSLLAALHKENIWQERAFASTKLVCYVVLAVNYASLGMRKEALECIKTNIEEMRTMGNCPQKIHTLTFTAEALHRLGEYNEAKPFIEEAYYMNLDYKIGIIQPHILSQYAHNLHYTGDILKALELFDACLSFNEKNGYMVCVPHHKVLMAQAYSSIGMDMKALDILKSAEEIALDQNNNYYLAHIYYETFLIGRQKPELVENNLLHSLKDYLDFAISLSIDLDIQPLIEKCKIAYADMQ